MHGAWSPVYDWNGQISAAMNSFQEIAHAVLIPSGVHQGRVLMWVFDTSTPITNTYIFDPFDPANLVAVNEPLFADIFCSGQTVAADGTIVVPGGIVPVPGAVQPVEAHVFDPTPPHGQNFWSYPGDMCQPRFYPIAITLNKRRGGRTLVLGGSRTLFAPSDPGNVAWETFPGTGSCTNGIYYPGTDPTNPLGARWAAPPQVGATAQSGQPFLFTPRAYHSVALLLPDGSVFVAGGEELALERNFTAKNMASSRHTGEIYHPPYQYYDAPLVQIIGAPNQVPFNVSGSTNTFTVTVESKEAGAADVIDRIVLLRPGAVTHHFDNDQRYIELAFAPVVTEFPGQVQITVTAPDEGVGPAAHYMLFVIVRNDVTGLRVPTRSVFIELT